MILTAIDVLFVLGPQALEVMECVELGLQSNTGVVIMVLLDLKEGLFYPNQVGFICLLVLFPQLHVVLEKLAVHLKKILNYIIMPITVFSSGRLSQWVFGLRAWLFWRFGLFLAGFDVLNLRILVFRVRTDFFWFGGSFGLFFEISVVFLDWSSPWATFTEGLMFLNDLCTFWLV